MIQLRHIIAEDLPYIRSMINDPELDQYFRRCPPAMDWANPTQMFEMFRNNYVVEEDGVIVGMALLGNYDFPSKTLEMGLALDKKLTSNRPLVCLEVYRQICSYVFDYLNYEKMSLKLLDHRKNLCKRLCEIGWHVEGVLKSNCMYRGERRDEVLMALLKENYLVWRKNHE